MRRIFLIFVVMFLFVFSFQSYGMGRVEKDELPPIEERLKKIEALYCTSTLGASADEMKELLLKVGVDIDKLWEMEKNEPEEINKKELLDAVKNEFNKYIKWEDVPEETKLNPEPILTFLDYKDEPVAYTYAGYKGKIREFYCTVYDGIEWLPENISYTKNIHGSIGPESSHPYPFTYPNGEIKVSEISIKEWDKTLFEYNPAKNWYGIEIRRDEVELVNHFYHTISCYWLVYKVKGFESKYILVSIPHRNFYVTDDYHKDLKNATYRALLGELNRHWREDKENIYPRWFKDALQEMGYFISGEEYYEKGKEKYNYDYKFEYKKKIDIMKYIDFQTESEGDGSRYEGEQCYV